jgi:hypothetical protein
MLKDKALASLAAGDLLLERGFTDDAASRYYYAMYRAAVHGLTREGRLPGQFRSGAVDWDHSMVENNAGLIRRSFEDRILYRDMREMRVLADYRPGSVNVDDLRTYRSDVAALVEELTR